jgi:ElaB/YqjD/DUF883 family membrane-anchored ribosome-binding protein
MPEQVRLQAGLPPQAGAQSDEKQKQLIRGDLKSVAQQAYQVSPLIQCGVDSLGWLASQPLVAPYVAKATALSEPYIDLADDRLSSTYVSVQHKVLEGYGQVQDHVLDLQTQVQGTVTSVHGQVTEKVNQVQTKVNEAVASVHDQVSEKVNLVQTKVNDTAAAVHGQVLERVNQVQTQVNHVRGMVGNVSALPLDQVYSLVEPAWFERVNYLQSLVLNATTSHLVDPATELYRTSLEYYISAERREEARDFINGMRHRLGAQWNDNLRAPIREFFDSATQTATDELVHMYKALNPKDRAHQLVSNGKEILELGKMVVTTQYGDMVAKAQSTVDYVLPDEVFGVEEDSNAASQPLTLRRVSNRVSKKLQKRATMKLAELNEIRLRTTNRVCAAAPIDLIAYAEEFLDNAKGIAVPHIEETQTAVTKALVQVQERVQDTRVAIAANFTRRKEQVREVTPGVRKFTAKLRARLQVAVDHVRALSTHGNQYLGSSSLRQLANDTAKFFTNLTAYELSGEISDPEYEEVIKKFDLLLAALRGVFVWVPTDADENRVSEEPRECCGEAEDGPNSQGNVQEMGTCDTGCSVDEPPLSAPDMVGEPETTAEGDALEAVDQETPLIPDSVDPPSSAAANSIVAPTEVKTKNSKKSSRKRGSKRKKGSSRRR